MTMPAGALKVPTAVRDALEDGDNELPMPLRHSLDEQLQRLAQVQGNMVAIEQRLEEIRRTRRGRAALSPRAGRGPADLATALRASAGDLSRFRNGVASSPPGWG